MEQNNIVTENEESSKIKYTKLFFWIAATTCVGIGIGYASYVQYQARLASKQAVEKNIEINTRYVEDINTKYANEAVPVGAEGTDPYNYGLNEVVENPQIDGAFLFSGVKHDEENKDIKIYKLDLGAVNGVPEVLLPAYEPSVIAVSGPTGASLFDNLFFITSSNYTIANEPDQMGVHKYNVLTDKADPLVSTKGKLERNLELSPDGTFLALNTRNDRKPNDYLSSLSIDNWDVVVADVVKDTVVTTVPSASQPHWSPDGATIVFLKRDGLYFTKVSDDETTKVLGVNTGGEVVSTSMIDVSSDGKYLLWTSAKTGVITLFEITAWDTFAMKEIGRINVPETEFYWPQFSADGKYYAVQAIDSTNGGTTRSNPRIEVRPTLSREVVYQFDLKDFKFDLLFTDDWRQ